LSDKPPRRSPWVPIAVVGVSLVYAAITPAMLGVLWSMRPEGTVLLGGFQGADDNLAYAMLDVGRTGRAWIPWLDPAPDGGPKAFFPWPVAWPYVAVGWVQGLVGASHLVAYNGAAAGGFLLFLLSAYYLYTSVLGRDGPWAYALFLFGGGVGGILYVLTCAASPSWAFLETMDKPFRGATSVVTYELFEGIGYLPFSIASRLYFTTSLAAGLAAVGMTWRFVRREGESWRIVAAGLLVLVSALLNLRFGAFTGALVIGAVIVGRFELGPVLAAFGVVVLAGGLAFGAYVFANTWPAGAEVFAAYAPMNLGSADPRAVLLSGGAIWIAAIAGLRWAYRSTATGGGLSRVVRGAALYAGALGLVFSLATLSYHIMKLLMLDWLRRRLEGPGAPGAPAPNTPWVLALIFAGAAAVAAPLALWLARRWRSERGAPTERARAAAFLALWLVSFYLVSINPFERLPIQAIQPRRLVALLWVPLVGLAVVGLRDMTDRSGRPRLAAAGATAMLIALGLPSLVIYHAFQVAVPVSEAAKVPRPDDSPFVAVADAQALAELRGLEPGRLLTSRATGTYATVLSGLPVVCCGARREFPDFRSREADVKTFYGASATDERRRAILERYDVAYVVWGDAERRLVALPADFASERPECLEPIGSSGRLFRAARGRRAQ
jgi:hypothetical protein